MTIVDAIGAVASEAQTASVMATLAGAGIREMHMPNGARMCRPVRECIHLT